MPRSEQDVRSIVRLTAACVAACDALVAVSEDCADACLAAEGNGVVTACFLADLDCIEICGSTSRVLSWHTRTNGPTALAILDTCREACRASSLACERMAETYEGWQSCAQACRRLSDACAGLRAVL